MEILNVRTSFEAGHFCGVALLPISLTSVNVATYHGEEREKQVFDGMMH